MSGTSNNDFSGEYDYSELVDYQEDEEENDNENSIRAPDLAKTERLVDYQEDEEENDNENSIRAPDLAKTERLVDNAYDNENNNTYNDDLEEVIEKSRLEFLEKNNISNEDTDLVKAIKESEAEIDKKIKEDSEQEYLEYILHEFEIIERNKQLSEFLIRVQRLDFSRNPSDIEIKNIILPIINDYKSIKINNIYLDNEHYVKVYSFIDSLYKIPIQNGKRIGICAEEDELIRKIILNK
jgi:hypothetical protein